MTDYNRSQSQQGSKNPQQQQKNPSQPGAAQKRDERSSNLRDSENR